MRLLTLTITLLAHGCAAPCVVDLDLDCAPLYSDLSWSNVHTQTIVPGCATGGGCHSATGAAGGLDLAQEATAWAALVAPEDAEPRVVAGDAACSAMIVRIESEGPRAMPPGTSLSDAERCVLRRWVADGALR